MCGERFVPFEAREAAKKMEKRQKVKDFIAGLEDALADPDMSDNLRAELEEDLKGCKEALAEAEATGATIYKE